MLGYRKQGIVRVASSFRLPALLLGGALLITPAQASLDPSRDVLWIALKGCLVTKKTTGRAFPYLAVDLGDQDRPGTAVLRAFGQPTCHPAANASSTSVPALVQRSGMR